MAVKLKIKRFISLLLAFGLCFNIMPDITYAAESQDSSDNSPVESTIQGDNEDEKESETEENDIENKNVYEDEAILSENISEENQENEQKFSILDEPADNISTDIISEYSSPPKVISQPQNVKVTEGETARFYVEAEGNSLSYQWQYSKDNGENWSLSTVRSSEYTTTATLNRNGWIYRCAVTDGDGNSVISDAAELTVLSELKITSQPENIVANVGTSVSFKVAALGEGLMYQWQCSTNNGKSWSDSSVKKASYTTTALPEKNGWLYRCVITDKNGGSIISDSAKLTVKQILRILEQPQDVTAEVGNNISFKVTAEGIGIKYQWQYSKDQGKNWINSTVKSAGYSTTATLVRNDWVYRCVVTDSSGDSVISNIARLIVLSVLEITEQPKDTTSGLGEAVIFQVTAVGESLTYQWEYSKDKGKSWTASTVKSRIYSTIATDIRNSWLYRCIITDKNGNSIISETASLTVEQALRIVKHPESMIADVGKGISFRVMAEGVGLNYQWEYSKDQGISWSASSVKTSVYSSTATLARDGWLYRCIVTDGSGHKITSDNAVLHITAGTILMQPHDWSGTAGSVAEFSTDATGDNLEYQWQYSVDEVNWMNADAGNGKVYSFIPQASYDSRFYRCVITNENGKQTITKTVRLLIADIIITTQPQDWTCGENDLVYFWVEAKGTELTYQWQYSKDDGKTWNVSTAVNNEYSSSATAIRDSWLYRCIITNEDGKSVTSDAARLTVNDKFSIIRQPVSYIGKMGDIVQLAVQAGGTGVTYQWEMSRDGVNGWEAITTTVTASRAKLRQTLTPSVIGKYYRCVISNRDGEKLSTYAVRITLSDTGFVTYNNKIYYITESGSVASGLKTIDGEMFYFGTSGGMQSGFQIVDGVRYYFDPDTGKAVTGFITLETNGNTYYFKGAHGALTGLQTIDGNLYYLGDIGIRQYGFFTIDSKKYYFSPDGTAAKGFTYIEQSHNTYYFGNDGTAHTGWLEDNGKKYYFYNSGVMARGITKAGTNHIYLDFDSGVQKTGLIQVGQNNYMYFSDENGMQQTGLMEIQGELYYFSEKEESYGVALSGMQTVNGKTYYFDSDTKKAVTGLVKMNGYTYYAGADRSLQTGIQTIDGEQYFFGPTGAMQFGFQYQNGETYYFSPASGTAISGWFTTDGGVTYYFSPETSAALTGAQKIDGKLFYFTPAGQQRRGLIAVDDKIFYFGDGENNTTGFQAIDGKIYYINEESCLLTGLQMIDNKLYYFNNSGVMQTGYQILNQIRYYFDLTSGAAVTGLVTLENGNTYYFDGAKGVHTGLYTIDGKLYYMNSNGIVQYGRVEIDGVYYYFNTNTGVAETGWKSIAISNGEVYKSYFKPETYQAVTGLQTIDDKLYYFNDKGWMQCGRYTLDNINYYFDMSTGAAYTGWYEYGGYYYYYDGLYGRIEGPCIKEIEGKIYYFNNNSVRATGMRTVEGIRMYFNPATAELSTGFVYIPDGSVPDKGRIYYFDGANGPLTGLQTIGQNQYYFSSSGIMQYGLQIINREKIYFNETTGERVTGLQCYTENGKYYLFTDNNVSGVASGFVTHGGVLYNVGNSGIPQGGFCSANINPLGFRVYFDNATGEQQLGLITYRNTSGAEYTYYFQKEGCQTDISGLTKALELAKAAGGWQEVGSLTYYARGNDFLKGVQEVEGKYYYFSEISGARLDGLRRIGNDYYYFDETNGAMQTGWVSINGMEFYFDTLSGKQVTGVQEIGGKIYCLKPGGGFTTGQAQIGKELYNFSESGNGEIVIHNGNAPEAPQNANSWISRNEKKYYYDTSGNKVTGLQVVGNRLYYFNHDGILVTGIVEVDGNTYYFTENGAAVGTQKIGADTYYFNMSDASMQMGLKNVSGIKYFFGQDGKMKTGWIEINPGMFCYLTKDRGILTGLQTIDGKTYWFGTSGIMSIGVKSVEDADGNTKICCFGTDGAMITGFVQSESGIFYYDKLTGERVTGWNIIDNSEFYFDSHTGKAVTGMKNINNFNYYFDSETAVRKTGIQNIDGKIYCFDDKKNGDGLVYGFKELNGNLYYFNENSGIAQKGYQYINDIKYYFDKNTGASVGGIHWIDSDTAYAFIKGGGYQSGLQEFDGRQFYFYPESGEMITGLLSIGNTLYYFDRNEGMLHNTAVEIDGITYSIAQNGAVSALGNSDIAVLVNSGISKLGMAYGSDDTVDKEENPSSYTCSDFVSAVFEDIGIELITTVYYQYYSLLHDGYQVEKVMNIDDARPGDIIYVSTVNCKYGEECTFWNELHHVMVYLGDGKVMQSTEGAIDGRSGVVIQDWNESATGYAYAIIRIKEQK